MASRGQALPRNLPVMSARAEWHIVTCEYPPQSGGVSDYTRLVANGLAKEGDRVHVWCPGEDQQEESIGDIVVHRALGRMSNRDLRYLSTRLNQFPVPRRLLIQWVPHG